MTTTGATPQAGAARAGGYARGRRKREQILQAAITLFGEAGFHGTSLRDIAGAAGISHPGLLHHFPTKAAVLEALLEHRDAVDEADLEADRERGTDLFTALVHLMERNALRPAIVDLYTSVAAEATSADHPAHAYFERRYARTVALIVDELAARRDAGELVPGLDLETTARSLVAIMDGMQLQWLLARDLPRAQRPDMAATLGAYLDLILVTPPQDAPAP
ncbi:TetR/AcrR family transcriptional regulator [Isoptericola sp. 178]|uniref:TetR/AcrR family transcriptional regulator n=1 Tax=Isoptericola sp. 178 TaxID=3064651 RepID=UPI002713A135|nr:TetR/AcrR family transcriptional regulator [Isoptericola sp. 178]MDO8144597.1 TetR/AcrR family transcriptional regulator [Isoptericola sp. 178]